MQHGRRLAVSSVDCHLAGTTLTQTSSLWHASMTAVRTALGVSGQFYPIQDSFLILEYSASPVSSRSRMIRNHPAIRVAENVSHMQRKTFKLVICVEIFCWHSTGAINVWNFLHLMFADDLPSLISFTKSIKGVDFLKCKIRLLELQLRSMINACYYA